MPIVEALVRWATGKRLTHRLPKLSLITPGDKQGGGSARLRKNGNCCGVRVVTSNGKGRSPSYFTLEVQSKRYFTLGVGVDVNPEVATKMS